MTPTPPTSNEPQTPTSPATGFRLPPEMNAPGICRGALTKWPQLHAAIEMLGQDPNFRAQFASSFGSPQASLIGSTTQLAALLAADPSCLLQPNPPADMYAWAVWLIMRVYQGARLFHLTLQHLPDIAKAAAQANPAAGEAIRDALAGIVSRARDISALANAFGQHLRAAGGNLSTAQAEHQAA